jgi:glycosyltransferase involved in cell wall biosynthesis
MPERTDAELLLAAEQTISVIIPTYNRAATLASAIESVRAQTRPVDEIIVIDDGSDDGTQALLADLGGRVRCCFQDHRGVSVARNRGIQIAFGEWLAFLDSDDRWCPTKIERQLGCLDGKTRIVHTDEIWIRDGRRVNAMRKHAKKGGWIYQDCLPLCIISPSSVMVHRSLFEEVGLFDESLPVCEDYDLWLRICARERVGFVSDCLIEKFGGHADQLSRRFWGMDRFRIRALEKMLEQADLGERDRIATLEMILHKAEIYLKGARKRGHRAEVERYESKRLRARQWLEASAVGGNGQ